MPSFGGFPLKKYKASDSETPTEGVIRRFGRSIKNYGENVVGGAKIVGSAIKSGINKVGTVVADDLFGPEDLGKKQKAAGEKLNAEYSGRVRRSTSDGSMR